MSASGVPERRVEAVISTTHPDIRMAFCSAGTSDPSQPEKGRGSMALSTRLSTMTSSLDLDELCVNTLRFLAVDMVQKAGSGHPGLPLGSASMAYALWDRLLKFNPRDPLWTDRDRFILSAGHGCALLYALLHVTGFDLPMEELKQFRQWESRTPGHPEYGKTPGVEATTGPLGQGLANAVGMAIAEVALAARFNRPDHTIVDHFTYVLVSDGDLEEGISSEAGSEAGHLRLGKLIVLYADNHITIEGSTELAFTEDRLARFAAFGWHIQHVEESNDIDKVSSALQAAQNEQDRPSLIAVRTHIGFGSPHKQDTAAAHGEPLGVEEVRLTKEGLGWPVQPPFHIPAEALAHFREAVLRGSTAQADWNLRHEAYAMAYPDLAAEFQRVMHHELPKDWDTNLPTFKSADGPMATRVASGKTVEILGSRLPEMMGGSADLAPSTHTNIDGAGNFEPENWAGRNMHFGIREHAMGAILNGIALHRGLIPFGGTFLVFSDYMRPPMRLAAMNGLPVIYVFTHDSLAMGEDGPTHQPVEQLMGLRSIPGMVVIRPADANETVAAWRIAIDRRKVPVALVLTRQGLPVLDLARYSCITTGVPLGGYILADVAPATRSDIVLIATGSEVHLALKSRDRLEVEGIQVRVVSIPSTNLFSEQSEQYREKVLPPGIPLLVVEAGISLGWRSYVGPQIAVISVDTFGASAPGPVVMEHYGFSVDNICSRVRHLLLK
jgi:transketolase